MLSEIRTINWLTELIHIPCKHSLESLRELYNNICKSCGYENFIRTVDGVRIEKGQIEESEVSTVTFKPDRILLVEDNTTMSVDQFVYKQEAVVKAAMETLGIPVVLIQQSTVRAITSPHCFKSAAEFMGKTLFRVKPEDLQPLGRPTSIFGLRLFFPATPQIPHQFNVRIESYMKDHRSVYIENVGIFKMPIPYQNLGQIGKNTLATAEFVSNNLCQFLTQFDKKEPE